MSFALLAVDEKSPVEWQPVERRLPISSKRSAMNHCCLHDEIAATDPSTNAKPLSNGRRHSREADRPPNPTCLATTWPHGPCFIVSVWHSLSTK